MKRSRFSLLIVLLLILPLACHKKSPTDSEASLPAWTYLFYDDADFEWAYDPLDEFTELFQTGENVQAVVLRDQENGPAGYYKITPGHEAILVGSLGEVDMGSAETLENFIVWANANYPAERTILAFYNHGGAWKGACIDKNPDNSILSMDEMQQGLLAAGGVDAVFFTAPCIMGAVESVYELRNCCDLYIGSEYPSGFATWKPMLNALSLLLQNSPDISLEELGRQIINLIARSNNDLYSEPYLSMTAIKTDGIETLAGVMDEVAAQCLASENKLNKLKILLTEESRNLEQVYSWVTDALVFVKAMADMDHSFSPLVIQARTAMDACLVDCCFSTSKARATGLNIYLPNSTVASYSPLYESTGLDFARDTQWGRMLESLWGSPAKASSDPLPHDWPPHTDTGR